MAYYVEGATTPKHGTFEWIVGWDELAAHLAPAALGLPPGARALDVGCGTSELPVHLAREAGYASVTAIDRDTGCIAHMAGRTDSVSPSTRDSSDRCLRPWTGGAGEDVDSS